MIRLLPLVRLSRVQLQRVLTDFSHLLANIDPFESKGLIKVGLNRFKVLGVDTLCR